MRSWIIALVALALTGWLPAVAVSQDDGDQPAVESPKKTKTKSGKKSKKGKDAEKDSDEDQAELAGAMSLFEAIKKERVKAQFVPQSSILASLTIINSTEQPLKVEIPAVLAGSPVVPRGTTDQPELQTYKAAIPQTVGGVISNRGKFTADGEAPKKQGGNAKDKDEPPSPQVVTLPPGGQQVFPVACVGLDFAKPSPLPIMPYELVDIDDASRRPEVRTVLEGLAAGRIEQDVAQLAAWHFNSGMNWEQLAATPPASFPNKLEMAKKVAEQAEKDVKAKAKAKGKKDKEKEKGKMEKKPNGKPANVRPDGPVSDDAELDDADAGKPKRGKKTSAKKRPAKIDLPDEH
jgi:hypothetical protein